MMVDKSQPVAAWYSG